MSSRNVPSLVDFEKQNSIYESTAHRQYRKYVREFCGKHLSPHIDKWEKKGGIPRSVFEEIAQYGGVWMFPFGMIPEWNGHKWDPFYALIFCEEIAIATGTETGIWIHSIGIPALQHFGKADVHRRAIAEVTSGKKLISLAISEMSGGSDVANIQSSAVLSDDKQHFIVNGNKYWITGGNRADWFTTLVRTTDSNGRSGLTLLLIPRCKGVFTSKLNLSGGFAQDTATVTFANVKVPIANVIGSINGGFKPLMFNFNFERFVMCCGMVGFGRLCIDDSIEWAMQRRTFGRPLIKHQIIAHKIAEMSRIVLSSRAFTEKVAYQLKFDPIGRKDKSIPRLVSLLKVDCSRMTQRVAIDARQIFGGRACVVGGRGAKVERVYRIVGQMAVSGGSEEILLDMAVRQAKL